MISVTINDGKYTIRQVGLGKWEVLRNGEPWPAYQADAPDNLHVALALAVNEVWQALGATTETEALERVMILQGVATGKLAKRHYAVTSISGAHIGLWSDRSDAVAVTREYPGSSLTELYEVLHAR